MTNKNYYIIIIINEEIIFTEDICIKINTKRSLKSS